MRYVPVRRAALVGPALLFLLSVCVASLPAEEEEVTVKVTELVGAVKVTLPDGTTETLTDPSKPIALPATIEMLGAEGSFSISLPTALLGRFNTVGWTMKQGETVRVSLLKGKKGVRIEYLKGTRAFFLSVNNRENVLAVSSVTGATLLVIQQNTVTIPEKSSAMLTTALNVFSSVLMKPGQVSELEFSYSMIEEPIVERLIIPIPEPETIEQSPYQPE